MYSTTQIAKIVVKHSGPSGASRLYGHHLCRTIKGKKVREHFVGTGTGESTELGMLVCSRETRFTPIRKTWMTKNPGKKKNMVPIRMWILMNQHHFLITCTWDALSVKANKTKIMWHKTKTCSSHVLLLEQLKIYQDGKNITKKQQHGPTTRKEIVNWPTRRQSSCTRFRVLAWMIITSRRRNLNQSENCQKFAHKLYSYDCTWHELVGQTFCGQYTTLLDQSQNRHKLVTEDWQD